MTRTILQIIPAPSGMEALWYSDAGTLLREPVVCLALVESTDEDGETYREALGMVASESQNLHVPSEQNVLGYRMPNDSYDWEEEARLAAQHAEELEALRARREQGARS